MGTRIKYQWVVEEVDLSTGPLFGCQTEIIDPMFYPSYPRHLTLADNERIAAVRDHVTPNGSVIDRAWAYANQKDGVMETVFRYVGGEIVGRVPVLLLPLELGWYDGEIYSWTEPEDPVPDSAKDPLHCHPMLPNHGFDIEEEMKPGV